MPGQSAPAATLLLGAEPETLRHTLPRQLEQVGVGGAGFGNGANIGRQNNACAAAAVALSSIGFSK